jgi:plasmid stabilization system protein ParE
MKSDSPLWFFNGLMLWGAGLGFIIGLFAVNIRDTIHHKGPGVVHHGDGERSPEWSEEVDEWQYKRVNYVQSGFMLALGLMFWFFVAKSARDNTAKAEAYKAYLEAQIRRAAAYHHAFASAVDDDVRDRATADARSSDEFREAREDEELASRIFYAACKAAKGDAE